MLCKAELWLEKRNPLNIMFELEIIENLHFEMENICRACGKSFSINDNIKLVPIFDDGINMDSFRIDKELELMQLRVYKDDDLPQRICEYCLSKLHKIYKLRIQFEELQENFKRNFVQFQLESLCYLNQEGIASGYCKEEKIEEFLQSELKHCKMCKGHHANDHEIELCSKAKDFPTSSYLNGFKEPDFGSIQFKNENEHKFLKQEISSTNNGIDNAENKTAQFICEICGEIFLFLADLISHHQMHAGNNENQVEVMQSSPPVITTNFQRKNDIRNIPSTSSSFSHNMCTICNKKFQFPLVLQNHIRLHDISTSYHEPRTKQEKQEILRNILSLDNLINQRTSTLNQDSG